MAGAKISLTSVHSFKSYLDPNLCSDFEPEQLLCSTKSWTVNLKSKFDPFPVKTFRLSRSQNKGRSFSQMYVTLFRPNSTYSLVQTKSGPCKDQG